MNLIVRQAVEFIFSTLDGDFIPKVALVLGSGLGSLVDDMKVLSAVPFGEIPGFHKSSVRGHAGQMVLGYLYGVPVVCMKGRLHIYEGIEPQELAIPIQTMRGLGADTLILTNAAGSLREEVGPGNISIIEDHINLTGLNVLKGPNDEAVGPRFVPMENAYDHQLRTLFQQEAQQLGFELPAGVYVGVLGPSYETPAEIRAFRILGGDLVGMSTVNEVIAARHCNFKIVGLSAVSNLAAGMSEGHVNHEEVLEFGAIASNRLTQLIKAALPKLVN